jgi:hypothetical protein
MALSCAVTKFVHWEDQMILAQAQICNLLLCLERTAAPAVIPPTQFDDPVLRSNDRIQLGTAHGVPTISKASSC